MKRILLASDLSERSQRALVRAVSLSKRYGSALSILHVVDDDQPRTLVDEECSHAQDLLRDELRGAGGGDLAIAPVIEVVAGDAFRAIADEADRLDADLVVMGSHRKRLLGDVFTGTTIERVMRLGGRPVLMVNRSDTAPYSKVLAAVDLSEGSAAALRAARDLGLLDPHRHAAVHGFVPLGEGMMHYAGIERDRIEHHVSASARQARASVIDFLREIGFGDMANLLLIEKGTAFEVIEAGIRQFGAELLVIGTRGHGGLKRVLLGSVADEVLKHVECDVLAVPPVTKPTSG